MSVWNLPCFSADGGLPGFCEALNCFIILSENAVGGGALNAEARDLGVHRVAYRRAGFHPSQEENPQG